MSKMKILAVAALASTMLTALPLATAEAGGEQFRLYTGERNRDTITGRITDPSGKPLRAMVELWYADISKPIETEERNGDVWEVPKNMQFERTLYHSTFTTPNGWYHVTAPDGKWMIRIHKGPEWSIEEFEIEVNSYADDAGDETTELDGDRRDVVLTHLYDLEERGWYSVDVHSHSNYSDGIQNPYDMYWAWTANGVDAAALTDHNQSVQMEEFNELTDEEFLALGSVEITPDSPMKEDGKGWGHHIAIDIPYGVLPGAKDPDNPVIWRRYVLEDVSDLQAAIDATKAAGGLYHPTHSCWPGDWPNGTMSSWGDVTGLDAVDVFTGWDVGPHLPTVLASKEYGASIFASAQFNMNTVCTQIWFEFLNAGTMMAAVADSDTHDVTGLLSTGVSSPTYWRPIAGNARTYVKSNGLRKNAIKQALEDGRAFVTAGYWGPLLIVEADGQYMPGDIVEVRDSKVDLSIEVLSNRPLMGYDAGVRVIQNGQITQTIPTHDVEGEMTMEGEVEISVAEDGWVVVQAYGDHPSMAMTNAIYFDVAPYGDTWTGEYKIPAEAGAWFNPFAEVDDAGNFVKLNIPEQTVPDMLEVQPPHPIEDVQLGEYVTFR